MRGGEGVRLGSFKELVSGLGLALSGFSFSECALDGGKEFDEPEHPEEGEPARAEDDEPEEGRFNRGLECSGGVHLRGFQGLALSFAASIWSSTRPLGGQVLSLSVPPDWVVPSIRFSRSASR